MHAPLWVFGYGSLIWDPGFPVAERRIATVTGWHRSFCMRSIHHRGTVDAPGLVLALDRADGAACTGVAFCVQPGHEAMIFDRFHQTDLGVQVAHGTGLGLPISRHIAEHFGGRLWLEPGAQPGACFCFWLPRQAPSSGDKNP